MVWYGRHVVMGGGNDGIIICSRFTGSLPLNGSNGNFGTGCGSLSSSLHRVYFLCTVRLRYAERCNIPCVDSFIHGVVGAERNVSNWCNNWLGGEVRRWLRARTA